MIISVFILLTGREVFRLVKHPFVGLMAQQPKPNDEKCVGNHLKPPDTVCHIPYVTTNYLLWVPGNVPVFIAEFVESKNNNRVLQDYTVMHRLDMFRAIDGWAPRPNIELLDHAILMADYILAYATFRLTVTYSVTLHYVLAELRLATQKPNLDRHFLRARK